MDTESVLTTAELSKSQLARQLISEHAARCGFPGQANFANWGLLNRWLALPAPRPSYRDWIIQTLGSK